MIYGFSLLFLVLGLAILVPAGRKFMHMRGIEKHSGRTRGNVLCIQSAMNTMGWLDIGFLRAVEVINMDRPLVSYRSPQGEEMRLDVVPSNFLSRQKYETGEVVEVAYDVSSPGQAYLVREWKAVLRDMGIGSAGVIAAVALWIAGRVLSLPF